jgi:predicted XRE-type DNA-binding protein
VGHSQNSFIMENFVDELALAAGKDPYEFRRAALSKSPRHKSVLELAAEKAGRGKPLPAGIAGYRCRQPALSRRRHAEKESVMSSSTKVDTRIRHVTKPGANIFLELGFPPAEAKRLHAASRKQIDDTLRLKQQLMAELSQWIDEHGLKQTEAAQILNVSRPRVSDVVNQKVSKFSIDALVEMLNRVGKPVMLTIG